MLFTSSVFLLIFLPILLVTTYAFNTIAGNKLTNILLLFASLIFYAWGEPVYILLMIVSMTINWIFGIVISRSEKSRKFVLALGIIINLCILFYYKYFSMLLESIKYIFNLDINIQVVALPIGISFFTFQEMSYIIDVYYKRCEAQYNYIKLSLYIAFFPQLIAGPIVQYNDIYQQIENRKISCAQIASGIRRFMYGLGKKVLVANTLAASVDRIYGLEQGEVGCALVWAASCMYTLQIYYDFSGYSDMAIGLARMFGFNLKENFQYPYLSTSLREFWRRWHISLSTWFKEYVYIPLGGSRGSALATYRNLLAIFFLTGLWHGASWNYVLWGMLHGMLILLERLGLDKIFGKNKWCAWLFLIFFLNTTFVIFRIEDIASSFHYLKIMFSPLSNREDHYSLWEFVDYHTLFIFICAIFGMGIIQKIAYRYKFDIIWKNSWLEFINGLLIFFLSFISIASNTYNPFIYFRF